MCVLIETWIPTMLRWSARRREILLFSSEPDFCDFQLRVLKYHAQSRQEVDW